MDSQGVNAILRAEGILRVFKVIQGVLILRSYAQILCLLFVERGGVLSQRYFFYLKFTKWVPSLNCLFHAQNYLWTEGQPKIFLPLM